MGSPTSNVEAWEGRWRRNKAKSHSVSSWSSEQRGGRQQPHEGARGNTETKSLCQETNSSSPNLVSSRVQISFHTALLGLPSSLPWCWWWAAWNGGKDSHSHPEMVESYLSGTQFHGVRTECAPLGSCLVEGNANSRHTLTTRASPPICSFVLLSGFHLFCTAQTMAIYNLRIHNCLSQSLQRQKIIFLICHIALDVGHFYFHLQN